VVTWRRGHASHVVTWRWGHAAHVVTWRWGHAAHVVTCRRGHAAHVVTCAGSPRPLQRCSPHPPLQHTRAPPTPPPLTPAHPHTRTHLHEDEERVVARHARDRVGPRGRHARRGGKPAQLCRGVRGNVTAEHKEGAHPHVDLWGVCVCVCVCVCVRVSVCARALGVLLHGARVHTWRADRPCRRPAPAAFPPPRHTRTPVRTA
jgi:hypothetical protein